MNRIQQSLLGVAITALVMSGCASRTTDGGLSPGERDAARRIPGAGSATNTFRGVEYVGSFSLDVTGETVSFYVNGFDSSATVWLSGRVLLPPGFARQQDGAIEFPFSGVADGSAGLLQVNSEPSEGYLIESGEIRTDATGLLSARIIGVRMANRDSNGFDIPGTGGERETLTVAGHLTGTCNVRLPSGDIIMDPEHTSNPLCAELLRGL